MIRLQNLLREVQSDKDKLDRAKELLATLAELDEDILDEASVADVAKKLKNLGLGLSLLTTLAAMPNMTAAQQKAIELAKQDTTAVTKILGSKDVEKVQTALQNVREVMIDEWKKGTMGIKLDDRSMDPKNSQDVDAVDSRYMPIVKRVTYGAGGRVGSAIDGIVGEYTSKYKFPITRKDTTELLTLVNGREVSRKVTTTTSLSTTMLNAAAKAGLSVKQMQEWNRFVDWLRSEGLAGDSSMNSVKYSKGVLNRYKKEVDPNFWVVWN